MVNKLLLSTLPVFILSILMYSNPNSKLWKLFELNELSLENSETEGSYLGFLNESSLSMGLYELKAGTEDTQNPHQLDEVYYVVEGNALLVAGKDTVAAEPGTIAYVKAGVPHHFENITKDLQVLVIFSKTQPSAKDPDSEFTTLKKLTNTRSEEENNWNSFLEMGTLRMGLYMLPKTINGDESLTHEVDEINIVVKGRATFEVENDEFEVKPGSIFFVEKNHAHRFKDLQDENLDVLILFHRK